ncbi:MGH1-like glycoside hydrolase domain-containing protein [Dyadobacter tibetensis]|uniref:MGH1-like glycoside hydrolase domain-containing protein n=1 Tax=Dyadobacter tibetensis TaxID=1211851 RepID=UPI00046FC77C|nr:glycosyl hydrolase family 65 protein [Dyadobacter tibetensis]
MNNAVRFILIGLWVSMGMSCTRKSVVPVILNAKDFRPYVDYFNTMEDENKVNAIPNEASYRWMQKNIPLFDCPQENFKEIYYYRWWSLRKHIHQTPKGYIFTEFLVDRSYADDYNMISCALGHHIYEGRWLHDQQYLDDYIKVWFRGNQGGRMKKLMTFSSWTADAVFNRYKVNGDRTFVLDMLPDLQAEYELWERERRTKSGLFWQSDVKDGMEESISGGRREQNARPTINSYMYGNALALSQMSSLALDAPASAWYKSKADTLKDLILQKLWNPEHSFFETIKKRGDGDFAQVREAIGYIPWYFNIPESAQDSAWKQVKVEDGFLAPFGLTTAERRHPEFRKSGCCKCEWDGAIWPFASAQTLTAMANRLNGSPSSVLSDSLYFRHLELYVESQYYRGRPYIGEYLDETTGYWLKGDQERSRYYNHSTFNDLIITGLVGLRPRQDGVLEINPLLPQGRWKWFCLDNILYKGRILTILWDEDGTHYNKGRGLQVFVDGRSVAISPVLGKMEIPNAV